MNDPAGATPLKAARIFVAGHRGMVGSAIVRQLTAAGCNNLLLPDRRDIDLAEHAQVRDFFQRERPEYVFVAAARVGGILATRPGRRACCSSGAPASTPGSRPSPCPRNAS
jgi:GDP-L-fucose synthase